LAFPTFFNRDIGKFLAHFKNQTTFLALIFVHRHNAYSFINVKSADKVISYLDFVKSPDIALKKLAHA